MLNFIKLLIKKNKILFIPIFLAIAFFGMLLLISKGSVLAPFIYTLF